MKVTVLTATLCLGVWFAAVQTAGAASPAWVEMTATGAEARLVSDAATCPSIVIDGETHPMSERAAPSEGFPNRVCEYDLPGGARAVSLDGQSLAPPVARPRRIVILGDSGCRLKGAVVQHCNDPSGWPFAQVAALAAARRPDLVIHVGDYYYRETPCPAGNAACAGSPYGDRWATWKAEVFDPAAPLLSTAPWVFARGNHEDCKRGGAGWFRLLDADPAMRACPAQSDTFAVDLGGVKLMIVDSADSEDVTAPADLVAAFASRLDAVVASDKSDPIWIVTHRPVWDAVRAGPLLLDAKVNATERAAVKQRDLTGVDLVLSGHVHDFTSLGFVPGRPAQLVVGTGGDLLNKDDFPPPATGRAFVDGLTAKVFTMGRFGYFLFERRGDDWVGAFHDLSDNISAICRLHGRALSCRKPRG
jgi:hypothetical protein